MVQVRNHAMVLITDSELLTEILDRYSLKLAKWDDLPLFLDKNSLLVPV